MNQPKRFAQIKKILIGILLLNWLVSLMKIVYGIITNCASMRADGMHSFSDGASNIIGLVGIWVASQPVDKGHPYGHKKYETFAAVGIAILLVLICSDVLRSATFRFFNPVIPEVTALSFYIILITLAINIAVMWYENKKAKELKSDILHSDAMHTASDILISISVIVTLVSIKMGFPAMDTIVAVMIAVFIGYAAFKILRDASNILCDRAAVFSGEIKDIVMDIKGVEECHRIRTRGREDDVHVDLHVLVSPDMHVDRAHNITELIEKEIKQKIRGITDVVVHIEPK
ncbi:MAG: cation transporter [Candidatus Omnitrophica bacterium]|nr:cation transporter [Candidatus Omnitrophota bacterium]